jgi:hypothetical protein
VQAQHGLADARGAEHAGDGGLRQAAAAEHRVQARDAGGQPARPGLVGLGALAERRLHARVDDEPVRRDAEGVAAGQVVAAAELVDEEPALGARAEADVRQLDDAVHHGVLGRDGSALGGGEQEGGAAVQRGLGLQLLDELLELGVRRRPVLRRRQPVQTRTVALRAAISRRSSVSSPGSPRPRACRGR